MVFGMVKDKDAGTILSLLPKDALYYFTQAHIPRALPAFELQKQAATWQLQGDCFDDVNEALTSAKGKAHKDDLIVVCGSIFLVAEVQQEQ
jgi:dihydrofolate synthase/folylpolyglutamate synthase